MRIDELRMSAFGPFSGTVLDFRDGQGGFHLVYGSNEAGKSSALRALRYLLYGIPERSTDNFIHPYSKMRIGGVLRSGTGEIFEIIRRKGRGNTLRLSDDTTIVEDTLLKRFLGGIDSDLFTTMFGIGYEDLVRGGREIIRGGGNIGEIIFSAGSGISNLREIQNELKLDINQLFKPSGRKKPKINEMLGRLKQSRKDLREAQLPGQEWEKHDETLQTALKRKKIVEEKFAQHQKNLNRLQRIEKALPFIARRKELLEELKDYHTVPVLPEDFPETRRRLITKLEIAEKTKTDAVMTTEAHHKVISQLKIATGLLDNTLLIEELYQELGSQRKASKDRITLETRRDTLRGEAKEILRSLRNDLTLEEAEKLRIKKAQIVMIQELGTRYERIVTRIEDAREKLPELSLEIRKIKEDLKNLDVPISVLELKTVLADAEEYGPLEKHNQTLMADIESSMETIRLEQNRLGLDKNTFEELESLKIPSQEAISRFEESFDAADRRLDEIYIAVKKTRDMLAETNRQIEIHRLMQEVPTEDDLVNARKTRDTGWRLIAHKLQNRAVSEQQINNYLKKIPYSKTLAEAFETSLKLVDTISDRLRRETDRVTTKARLLADQSTFTHQMEQLEKEAQTAEEEKDGIKIKWAELWRSAEITPESPREMLQWALNFKALTEKINNIREQRSKSYHLKQNIDTQRTNLAKCLKLFQGHPKKDGAFLVGLIKHARLIIDHEKELSNKREHLLQSKARQEKALKTAKSRLEINEEKLKQWQAKWEEAVEPIGLDAEALPAQATAVMEDLKTLFDKLKDAGILQKRINGIDRDSGEFIDRVKELAQVAAPDLIQRTGDEIVLELHRLLKQASDARSKQKTLEKQLKQEQNRLKQATDEILQVKTELTMMCEEANCKSYKDLSGAERRSNRRKQIEKDLKSIGNRLRELSSGATVEDFIQEAIKVDPDGITGNILEIKERIEKLDREKSDLDQDIGSEKTELSKMDGSSRAAVISEKIHILLGGMENDVENYARLKIAAKVLNMAIERYQEKSQGPILKKASILFNHLTCGSFTGVRAEFDHSGLPVMVGVRSNNKETVNVDGMSDGTADQLYLALRLAGLGMYLEKNEPVPFIVDDILIKFDNERAVASLQALAEISKQTQLIFFTHHLHLVELAENNVDPSLLIKHTLNS